MVESNIRVAGKLERDLPTYMWTSWKWFSVELQDSPTPVSAMVSDLGWEPLQTRRLHGRLNMVFCTTRGTLNSFRSAIQTPVPRHQPAARGHSQQFQRLQPSVDAYKYAFFPRMLLASPSGASRGRVTHWRRSSCMQSLQ